MKDESDGPLFQQTRQAERVWIEKQQQSIEAVKLEESVAVFGDNKRMTSSCVVANMNSGLASLTEIPPSIDTFGRVSAEKIAAFFSDFRVSSRNFKLSWTVNRSTYGNEISRAYSPIVVLKIIFYSTFVIQQFL